MDPPWQNPLTSAVRPGRLGSNVVYADGHTKLVPFGRIQGSYQTACQNPVVRPNLPQCN